MRQTQPRRGLPHATIDRRRLSSGRMRTIVQVEYRSGLLTVREEIRQFLGHPVVSAFGSQVASQLDLADQDVGVILIAHTVHPGKIVFN